MKKGLNFGEKLFKKVLYMQYVLNYFETISLMQRKNVLRVLFIPRAANNNCDDSIADNSCF